jgi:hypothetical protein
MEAAKDDPELFAAKDSEFHRRLAQTTHNPLLTLLLDSIQDLMAEVREFVAKDSSLFEQVMPAHADMLKYVAMRDPRKARRAMRAHVQRWIFKNAQACLHQSVRELGRNALPSLTVVLVEKFQRPKRDLMERYTPGVERAEIVRDSTARSGRNYQVSANK